MAPSSLPGPVNASGQVLRRRVTNRRSGTRRRRRSRCRDRRTNCRHRRGTRIAAPDRRTHSRSGAPIRRATLYTAWGRSTKAVGISLRRPNSTCRSNTSTHDSGHDTTSDNDIQQSPISHKPLLDEKQPAAHSITGVSTVVVFQDIAVTKLGRDRFHHVRRRSKRVMPPISAHIAAKFGSPATCPLTVDGAACDDQDLCNGRETCKAGACAPAAAPLSCDDLDPCTSDLCTSATGCSPCPRSATAA